METFDWIIGVCNTSTDGVKLFRFRGTIQETKEKLFEMVNEDRTKDSTCWEYGCETVEEINEVDNGLGYELYGYGNYTEYHIDYSAIEFAHIDTI